jgi:transcription elongation factor GreA
MTSEGLSNLEEELRQLRSTARPEVIRAIAQAREHGDLSENAEYHAARDRQSFIEGRVSELEDKIARAEVIDVSKLSGKTVKFGAKVSLIDEDTEQKLIYQIVGQDEADVKQGRLAITSPLARALIGNRRWRAP